MADGFDGFEAFKGHPYIIDDENGQTMSAIIRSFLLGSAYIFRHKQLQDAHHDYLSSKTVKVLSRARLQHQSPTSSLAGSPLATSPTRPTRRLPSESTDSSPERSKHDFSPGSPDVSFSSMSIDTMSMDLSPESWSLLRRHVVEHDWVTIREAMHVAKNEHMSSIDACAGDKIRRRQTGDLPAPKGSIPVNTPKPSMLVNEKRKAELKELATDVAIVSPQIDGRLRDVAPDGAV